MANESIRRMQEANVGMSLSNINPHSPAAIVKTEHSPATQNVLAQFTKAFQEIAKLENNTKGLGRELNIKDTDTRQVRQNIKQIDAGSNLNQFA